MGTALFNRYVPQDSQRRPSLNTATVPRQLLSCCPYLPCISTDAIKNFHHFIFIIFCRMTDKSTIVTPEAASARVQEDDDGDETTKICPPSHVLEDGRFIYLPQPTAAERSKFFERSIAKHGLLQADIMRTSQQQQQQASGNPSTEEKETSVKVKAKHQQQQQPQLHPLAVASARLQASGIMELNRAINLSSLVSTGEYFGLSNIVDPSLEMPTVSSSSTTTTTTTDKIASTSATAGGKATSATTTTTTATTTKGDVVSSTTMSGTTATKPSGANNVGQLDVHEEQRIRALYVCKRKRDQFEKAAQVLERHERRLAAALAAQTVVDQRLVRLRPQWRLVAPEHGTRAKPHPVRPTEVVAIDVDVYDRDRLGSSSNQTAATTAHPTPGRIARRVTRYATLELKDDYRVAEDLAAWKKRFDLDTGGSRSIELDGDDNNDNKQQQQEVASGKTRAEPFAVADPTLGNIDVDFDPNKVPMLTLQFDIEKTSTGFCQSSTLLPLSTISTDGEKRHGSSYEDDEKVVVALQHSLFCASLFESIRREVASSDLDESDVGRHKTTTALTPAAWLASESEEIFLPPPSFMVGAHGIKALSSLCVVHCHEGEVEVQLDCEYSLTVKLVEAGSASSGPVANATSSSNHDDKDSNNSKLNEIKRSGSHSPQHLLALCRALLLHAQDVYHGHSVVHRAKVSMPTEKKDSAPAGLDRIKKSDPIASPRILQSCVSLGSKMLFERRIRRVLMVRVVAREELTAACEKS